MNLSPSQIIVLATPVFFILITVEFAWGYARRRNSYRLNDAISSIALGMLSQVSAVFTRLFRIGIYTAIYSSVALFPDEVTSIAAVSHRRRPSGREPKATR